MPWHANAVETRTAQNAKVREFDGPVVDGLSASVFVVMRGRVRFKLSPTRRLTIRLRRRDSRSFYTPNDRGKSNDV